ncbi:GIY-YIG nuclease family protein [Clostridium botulinum]|nr:GIY-YIG nuclease family protein [Clostridium botulinum]
MNTSSFFVLTLENIYLINYIKVDGEIMYIGSTTHLKSRLSAHKQHRRKGLFLFI